MVKYTIENIFKNMKKRVERHQGYVVKFIHGDGSESIVVEYNGKEVWGYTMISGWKHANLSELKDTRRCGLYFSRKLDTQHV